jgi:glutaredoxin
MKEVFMRTVLVFLLLLVINPTSPALSEIYKWVDENGRINFSDTPPAGVNDVVEFEPTPSYSSTDLPNTKTDYSHTTSQKQPPIKIPTKRHEVDLYVTDWCPYCKKAEKFFESRNIQVSIYDIEKDKKAKKRKEKMDGRNGVPFAVINGKKIRGYNESLYIKALTR